MADKKVTLTANFIPGTETGGASSQGYGKYECPDLQRFVWFGGVKDLRYFPETIEVVVPVDCLLRGLLSPAEHAEKAQKARDRKLAQLKALQAQLQAEPVKSEKKPRLRKPKSARQTETEIETETPAQE